MKRTGLSFYANDDASDEQPIIAADMSSQHPDTTWLKIEQGDTEITYFFRDASQVRGLIAELNRILPSGDEAGVAMTEKEEVLA